MRVCFMDTKRKDAAPSKSAQGGERDERELKRHISDVRPRSVSGSASPAPPDSALYCVCRQTYGASDDDRLMIGCDVCDQWFHASCMRVDERHVQLIDTFVCETCTARTSQCTTFRVPCHRRACRRPARMPMSRYCSDACGMAEIRARMHAMHVEHDTQRIQRPATVDKRRGMVVWMQTPPLAHSSTIPTSSGADAAWFDSICLALKASRPLTLCAAPGTSYAVSVRQHATRLDTRQQDTTQWHAELRGLEQQCATLHTCLDLLNVRIKLVHLAETNDELGLRVYMDDESLAAWATSQEGRAVLATDTKPPNLAGLDKRKADWVSTHLAELGVLYDAQTARLSALSERSHTLRIAIERAH